MNLISVKIKELKEVKDLKEVNKMNMRVYDK